MYLSFFSFLEYIKNVSGNNCSVVFTNIYSDNICDDDKKTAKTFHEYFVNIVQKSGIVIEKSNIKPTELHFDQLNMAIVKPVYNDHLGDEVSLVVIDRWPL